MAECETEKASRTCTIGLDAPGVYKKEEKGLKDIETPRREVLILIKLIS